MLILSVQKPTLVETKSDGFDFRLDCFPHIDKEEIGRVMKKLSGLSIFTLRRGGRSEKERLALLEDLLSLQPDYIDLEHDTDPNFIDKIALNFPDTKILLSYHNFEETPENLPALLESIKNPLAHAYKIATMAKSSLDAMRMLLFLKNSKGKNLCGICMGEDGQFARVLGPIFGTLFDYTYDIEPVAPGQISISELHSLYNYRSLEPSTKIFGVIGDPIAKTMGALTHNPLMRHHLLNAVYVKIRVKKEELPEFFSLAKQIGFAGLSVTMPLKEEILPFLNGVEEGSKKIGAINTLLFNEQNIFGCNTDGKGALDALEEKIPVKGKKVVLLGAGGAARAIAYEARLRGAELLILNRTKKRALELAEELHCEGGGLEEFPKEYDIVINTTPSPLPIDPSLLIAHTVAMDIKSRPKMPEFLVEAEKKGCTIVYGYKMFVHQALGQYRFWFNKEVDKDFLDQECRKHLLK